jgi:hypothetical protein
MKKRKDKEQVFSDVSEQMYEIICKYCGNCEEKYCLKKVPWYAASIHCKYWLEPGAEIKPVKKAGWIRRRVLKSLVETF